MKNIKSNLFKKFEDSNLTKESLEFIEGGGGPGSTSTGDNDCTKRGGWGSDCGDIDTSGAYDADPTDVEYDSGVNPQNFGGTGSVSLSS